ncbi:MAG: serine/threonine protein kinase [Planctomycetales bacterium]|nr:serine/threonine protein kinase [Planctomycetales bacterium]
MTEQSPNFPPEDNYPHIDAKVTDKQLSKYFSNSFNRYTNFAPLAKGGAALLQSCFDNNLGRNVVMKILHPHLANNEYMRARFLREARVTAQLQHPCTVPVYEIGHDLEGRLYFTMKKVEGETIRDILEKQISGDKEAIRTYNLDRMLGLLIQVCNALAYAHVHGVVHRDVKPENILIGSFGEVILLDWGVAKVWAADEESSQQGIIEHEELTDMGQRPGTPLYMAPEQVRGGGDAIDGRTDIYSIGVVLYEILTLKEPLRGEQVSETFDMIVKETPIPPQERTPNRHIPPKLAAIALKSLEKDPSDRYQTMPELIDALRDFRSRAFESIAES